jgi:hypothetical protein
MNNWYLTQGSDQRDAGKVAGARVPTGRTKAGTNFSEKDDRNFVFRTVGDTAGAVASGFRAVVPEPVRNVGGNVLRTAWNAADTPLSQRVGFKIPEMRGPLDEIGNFVLEEGSRPSNYGLAAASFLTGGTATPALFASQMAARTGARAAVASAARPLTQRLGGSLTRAALQGSAPKRAMARMAGGIIEPASGLGTRGIGNRVGAEVATAAGARGAQEWADQKLEEAGASKGWRIGLGLAAGLAGGMGGAMGSRRALQSLGKIDADEVAGVRALLQAAKGATPAERQGIYRRAQRDALRRGSVIEPRPQELVDPDLGYWQYNSIPKGSFINPNRPQSIDGLIGQKQLEAEARLSQTDEAERFGNQRDQQIARKNVIAEQTYGKRWNNLSKSESDQLNREYDWNDAELNARGIDDELSTKIETEVNNQRASADRNRLTAWRNTITDPIRRGLEGMNLLTLNPQARQIYIGYDAAQSAAENVRSGQMTELSSRFGNKKYQNAAGEDIEMKKSFSELISDGELQLNDLPTTVVDNKRMYDLDAAVEQGLLEPPHKELLEDIVEIFAKGNNVERANEIEVDYITGNTALGMRDLKTDQPLLGDFIENAYSANGMFSETGANRSVYFPRKIAGDIQKARREGRPGGMVLGGAVPNQPRVTLDDGKTIKTMDEMLADDKALKYETNILGLIQDRLKSTTDAVNKKWVNSQLETYGTNMSAVMQAEHPTLVKQLSQSRNKLYSLIGRQREDKIIRSVYGKEHARAQKEFVDRVKKDMDDIQAALDASDEPLSLGVLKEELNQLQANFREMESVLTGAKQGDLADFLERVKGINVNERTKKANAAQLRRNAGKIETRLTRHAKAQAELQAELDDYLRNNRPPRQMERGAYPAAYTAGLKKQTATYARRINKLNAEFLKMTTENEKLLAEIDYLDTQILTDVASRTQFNEYVSSLRGQNKEQASELWASIRAIIDQKTSEAQLSTLNRAYKRGDMYTTRQKGMADRANTRIGANVKRIENARAEYQSIKRRYDRALQQAKDGVQIINDQGAPASLRRTIDGDPAGRIYGEEFARQIERDFNNVGPLGGFGKAVGNVNNISRSLLATMDFSNPGIQGLLAMASHPLAASKAIYTATVGTIMNPQIWDDFVLNNWSRTVNINGQDVKIGIKDFIDLNGKWMSADATGEMLLNQPGILDALKRTDREVFGKKVGLGAFAELSNTHFSRQGNLFRYMMFTQAMENKSFLNGLGISASGSAARTSLDDRRDIVETINNMTGWTNNTPTDVEKSLLFAPRFFRSQIETLSKAASRQDAAGDYARDGIVKFLVLGSGFVFFANKMAGEETDVNPIKFRSDGTPYLNSNFMKIRAFGTDISVFGPWQGMFQMITVGLIEGPDAALTRTIENKANIGTGTAIDIISGSTYEGTSWRPKSTGDFFKLGVDLTKSNALPISFQESIDVARGKAPVASGAFGFLGINAAPLTAFELRENAATKWMDTLNPDQRAMMNIAEGTVGYSEMSKGAKGLFDELYPEYDSAYFEDKRKYAARGDKDAQRAIEAHDVDVERVEKQKELVRLAELGAVGDVDPATGNRYQAISPRELASMVSKIDYESSIRKSQIYGDSDFGDGSPLGQAKSAWFAIYENNNIGGVKMDWDGVSRDQEQLLASLEPEIRDELEDFNQSKQKYYIDPLRPIVDAKQVVRESGYYDIGAEIYERTFLPVIEQVLGQRVPTVDGFQDLFETLKYSNPQQAQMLAPINSKINSYLRQQREMFRLTRPEVQDALETLGWVNPMPRMA